MTSVPRKPSPGFSLIELMVVISIIVIVSAASIPMGLNFVRHYRITGAAQGILAGMQKARAQAVKRNTSRGILLNFNYPAVAQYQFTSLDPNPMTGNWDKPAYPENPGIFVSTTVDYGAVPLPPDNVQDPEPGVQSPHGIPVGLPQEIQFLGGDRNALLFRADGSVTAVNADGPVGPASITRAPNGVDWMITLRDQTTNLTRIVRVSPGGRVSMDNP